MRLEMRLNQTTSLLETIKEDYELNALIQKAKTCDYPIFAISKNALQRQYKKLNQFLPMAKSHFAIKALPLQEVVDILHLEDGYFDVASNGEIDLLKKAGVCPTRIIHTHPIKRINDIEYALAYGIKTFVVDNIFELEKFAPYKDKARLLLRLSFRNPNAICDLSAKFGLEPDEAVSFILRAKHQGFTIDGISFHVGSNCFNPDRMLEALNVCRNIYAEIETYGITFTRIDIGGGFPIIDSGTEEDECAFFEPISYYLKSHFSQYEIISEPGRYIAAPSAILLSKVIGKSMRQNQWCYYLNDGVYNNFSAMIFEKTKYQLFTEYCISNSNLLKTPCTLFGPTCDSIDHLGDQILMPELSINDIIITPQIGAYSIASSSNFNFLGETIIHIEN